MSGSSSLPPPSQPPPNAPTGPKKLRFQITMSSRSRLQPTSSRWSRTSSPAAQRHTSSPLVHSPLQQSFPAEPDKSNSVPNSPKSMATQETPSRRSRFSEQTTRPRGESRSSSVPIIVRAPEESEDDTEGSTRCSFTSRSQQDSRATSPLPSPGETQEDKDRRSVKHLTCFWWSEKGECKFSDEDCLYAHHDTGHYTSAPRQVIPGEPAKAGKSLERALTKIALTNRSSTSLASLGVTDGSPMGRYSVTIPNGGLSRPETPAFVRSRPNTPSPRSSIDFGYSAQLRNDNDFLRSLVQQNQREKQALMDTIESLQGEKSGLVAQVKCLTEERTALFEHRDALQATIRRIQFPTGINPYSQQGFGVQMRSPSATTFPTPNPWGAIGSGPRGNPSRPDTPISTPMDSPDVRSLNSGSSDAICSDVGIHAASAPNPTTPAFGSMNRTFPSGDVRANTPSNNNSGTTNGGRDNVHNMLRQLGPSF